MTVKVTNVGTTELWQQFSRNPVDTYREIAGEMRDRGVEIAPTMSRALEYASPSEDGDSLDAYGRLMRQAGIIRRSNPAAGYWASPADRFLKNAGTRALLTEFFARNWRRVVHAPRQGQQRATYLSTDGTAGSWQRPYADAMARWDEDIAPAIPLSEVLALTNPISGADYRSFYLTYDAEQLRKFRVGESTDIPIAKLADSERTIRLKKYGRGLEASYEQLRRINRVDKLAMQIQFMAIQSEIDKLAAVIDIIINGDGNSGTSATNYNLTTLDTGATAGTLTLKGWLAFKKKLSNPYFITTALMQEDVALQLELLSTGNANIPLVTIAGLGAMGGLRTINRTADSVGYGWTADAPSLKIVALDMRRALEQLVEIGSEITEMERFVRDQTQVLMMSEVNGFAVMDQHALITLDVNA